MKIINSDEEALTAAVYLLMLREELHFIDSKESIFARMTHLAQQKKGINLAQGFPDFSGPDYLINRLHMHLDSCSNQYTRSAGHPAVVHALAEYYLPLLPRAYDALKDWVRFAFCKKAETIDKLKETLGLALIKKKKK